jgi:hypothetical protein
MTTPPPAPDAETREPDLADLEGDLGDVERCAFWARKFLDREELASALKEMHEARDRLNATIAAAERMKEAEEAR